MIITVTPSPSVDLTLTLDHFELGGVNRTSAYTSEPSGKGINVSWALHRAGIRTLAILPSGGANGAFITSQLEGQGVPYIAVPTRSEVRTNITLITPTVTGTKINMPGAALEADELGSLFAAVAENARAADAVVSAGSLPPNVDASFHQTVVKSARAAGAYAVVDSSAEPLKRALGAQPDLIKPNVHELAELTGRRVESLRDVYDAAQSARDLGAGAVLASLGPDGVLYVDGEGALRAFAEGIAAVNTVGAGDALLAGFVAGGSGRAERLENAVLWASSAVTTQSTLFPVRPELRSAIRVEPWDAHAASQALADARVARPLA